MCFDFLFLDLSFPSSFSLSFFPWLAFLLFFRWLRGAAVRTFILFFFFFSARRGRMHLLPPFFLFLSGRFLLFSITKGQDPYFFFFLFPFGCAMHGPPPLSLLPSFFFGYFFSLEGRDDLHGLGISFLPSLFLSFFC